VIAVDLDVVVIGVLASDAVRDDVVKPFAGMDERRVVELAERLHPAAVVNRRGPLAWDVGRRPVVAGLELLEHRDLGELVLGTVVAVPEPDQLVLLGDPVGLRTYPLRDLGVLAQRRNRDAITGGVVLEAVISACDATFLGDPA